MGKEATASAVVSENASKDAVSEKEAKASAKAAIIEGVVKEGDILEVIEEQGDEKGNLSIGEAVGESLDIKEGEKIYTAGYGGRVFFFREKEGREKFIEELKKGGAKKKEIKERETEAKEGKIIFSGYEKELGDMREGVLIIKYERGINEIKEVPEEVKRARREEIVNKIVKESKASLVVEAREEEGKVVMAKEYGEKLGIKEGSKIYLVHYGKRIFLFNEKEKGTELVEKLKEAGAQIGEENIREVEGVYIKEEIGIKKEEIKELGDLSKGIIVEEYKDNVKEMKSIAEEERRKKEEEISEEKIGEAEERREKPVIKAYRLNIVNFGTNEHELTKEAKETIKRQAKEIRKYNYKKITVEGHTDATGKEEINERISRKRAEAVYKEFILNGIPAEKIRYEGFSAKMPIESNKSKEGKAANRRTEIFVE
jgi:outer membrane protein OmpA-like peptidoglycan-associated protein